MALGQCCETLTARLKSENSALRAGHLRPPTFERLGQISASTLVLIGEHDQPEFQAAVSALNARIPDSIKVMVLGAGHMANMDRPRRVTSAILHFLAGSSRAATWDSLNVRP